MLTAKGSTVRGYYYLISDLKPVNTVANRFSFGNLRLSSSGLFPTQLLKLCHLNTSNTWVVRLCNKPSTSSSSSFIYGRHANILTYLFGTRLLLRSSLSTLSPLTYSNLSQLSISLLTFTVGSRLAPCRTYIEVIYSLSGALSLPRLITVTRSR